MTRERLRAVRSQLAELRQLRERLARLEARMYSPKSIEISDMPRGGGGGDAMVDMVSSHSRLVALYRAKIEAMESEQIAVEEAIVGLRPAEREVIRARYLDGLTWEEICVEVGYAWAQVHRIHGAALRRLEEEEKPEG